MANINVYGTFNSMAEDQTVAKAAQIYDDNKLKNQQTINQELEEKIDNLDFNAENIGYDRTQTPDLGSGNVQSAIEALDGKVEAVDARIDDEKVEFIKNVFPSKLDTDYTRVNRTSARFDNGNLVAVSAGSTFYVTYTAEKVPKGSLIHLDAHHSSNSFVSSVGYATSSPVDWYAEHSTMVGFTLTEQLYWKSDRTHDAWMILPEDGYLVFGWVNAYSYNYTRTIYPSDAFKDYYNKGVADGSGMASIVGLGYNVYDHISGEIDLEGFEYGCRYMRNSIITPLTGTLKQRYNSNKSFVYFPKVDVSGLTPDGEYAFAECSNLVLIPDMNYRTGSEGDCYRMFDNCKKLKHVGSFGNMQPTRLNYMFSGCSALLTVGKIDTSKVTTLNLCFNSTGAIRRVEEFDFTAMGNVAQNDILYTSNNSSIRYWLIKNIGTKSSSTSLNFSRVLNWGIPDASYPQYTSDARQSLIDTLITYSFDRATAGYSACTITLSANTKALLTEEEIEQITAKGYTIA